MDFLYQIGGVAKTDQTLRIQFKNAAGPVEAALGAFRIGGKLAYEEYLSPTSFVRSQRNLAADLGGNVVINPQGTVAFSAATLGSRAAATNSPTLESNESYGWWTRMSRRRIWASSALALRFAKGRRVTGRHGASLRSGRSSSASSCSEPKHTGGGTS